MRRNYCCGVYSPHSCSEGGLFLLSFVLVDWFLSHFGWCLLNGQSKQETAKCWSKHFFSVFLSFLLSRLLPHRNGQAFDFQCIGLICMWVCVCASIEQYLICILIISVHELLVDDMISRKHFIKLRSQGDCKIVVSLLKFMFFWDIGILGWRFLFYFCC